MKIEITKIYPVDSTLKYVLTGGHLVNRKIDWLTVQRLLNRRQQLALKKGQANFIIPDDRFNLVCPNMPVFKTSFLY